MQVSQSEKKPLWIMPLNEAGIRKLVCTTIQPTLLRYPEMATLSGAVELLSDIIDFEPLDQHNEPPKYLLSPDYTLKWQVMPLLECDF